MALDGRVQLGNHPPGANLDLTLTRMTYLCDVVQSGRPIPPRIIRRCGSKRIAFLRCAVAAQRRAGHRPGPCFRHWAKQMKPTIRILLVEDSPDDAELLIRAMKAAPFMADVLRVDTEPDFLQQLQLRPPDVVLCDYNLPRFDSVRALALLQKCLPNTPLIIISHDIGEEAAVAALRNGAADYLLKSRMGRLPTAIEGAIAKAHVSRERDANEALLRHSEAQKRGILDSLLTRVALVNEQGIILAVNKVWESFASERSQLKIGASEVGTDYFTYLEGLADRFDFAGAMVAGARDVLLHRSKLFTLEYQLTTLGNTRWYMMRVMPLEAGETGIVVLHEDVTDRMLSHFAVQDANKRLRLLSKRLLTAQEEERRSISRDLHDDLGQTLTALKISLHMLQSVPADDLQRKLGECIAVAEGALEKMRQMALDLHPPQLEQLGIEDALRWLTTRHAEQTGVAIEFQFKDIEGRLPKTIELACFRITQEALSNATRHAHAKRILVQMGRQGDLVKLLIQDYGSGFDLDAARARSLKHGSLGLISMEERAQLAGGRLQLRSVVGVGTTITVLFPMIGPADDGVTGALQET
ncbi:MAG: response regulator [Betaproteobacteria bacterium]